MLTDEKDDSFKSAPAKASSSDEHDCWPILGTGFRFRSLGRQIENHKP
jgi:hypothetical protein